MLIITREGHDPRLSPYDYLHIGSADSRVEILQCSLTDVAVGSRAICNNWSEPRASYPVGDFFGLHFGLAALGRHRRQS